MSSPRTDRALIGNVLVSVRGDLLRVSIGAIVAAAASVALAVVAGTAADGLRDRADSLWWVVGGLVALGLLEFAAARWYQLTAVRAGARVVADLRQALVDGAHRGGDRLARTHGESAVVSLAVVETEQVDVIVTMWGQLVAAAVASVTTLVVTAAISWRLALLVAVVVVVAVTVGAVSDMHLLAVSLRSFRAGERVATLMSSVVDGRDTIDGLGLADPFRERARRDCDEALVAATHFGRALAWSDTSGRATGAVALVGLVVVLAVDSTNAPWSVGDAVTALSLIGGLVPHTGFLALAVGRLATTRAAAQRLTEVTDAVEQVAPAGPLDPSAGIVLDRVSVLRGASPPALDAVTLSIPTCSFTVVCGPTGAGKSLLLDVLRGAIRPSIGTVRLLGVDPADLPGTRRPGVVALAEQHPFLYDESLSTNLEVADPSGEGHARALGLAAGGELAATLGGRRLGRRGTAVSGGQRRRISVARAIAAASAVLVLDDPSGSLDPATEATLAANLRHLAATTTVVVVSNRPALAASADRCVLMERGRVVATGSDAALRATSSDYVAVLGETTVSDDGAVGDR